MLRISKIDENFKHTVSNDGKWPQAAARGLKWPQELLSYDRACVCYTQMDPTERRHGAHCNGTKYNYKSLSLLGCAIDIGYSKVLVSR